MSTPPPPTEPEPNDAGGRRRTTKVRIISIAVGVVLAAALGTTVALVGHSSAPTLASVPQTFGNAFDHTIPSTLEHLSLVDQHGKHVDLADYRGRVLVLADFLTSCQDECPISTGALLTLEHDLVADGLEHKVAIVEVTVDAQRDTPARLLAYQRYTGVNWTLLTASASTIEKFWKPFGAFYNVVPDAKSDTDAIDWETGKQYTYDVDHSNDIYLFDASGHERLLTEGLPSIGKTLPPRLESLLSPLGKTHLENPGFAAWTEADLRTAIGALLGQNVPGTAAP